MRILTIIVMSLGASHQAFARAVETLSQAAYDALKPAQMSTNKIYYTQKVLTFEDWAAKFPLERRNLSLYPTYVEPKVHYIKNSLRKERTEKLMIFSTQSRVILNAAPEQIDVKSLVTLASLRKFDADFKHVEIQPNQIMHNVVGKGQVNNFKWCNKDPKDPAIARPQREIDLQHTQNKRRAWCSDPTNSICVETCYVFDLVLQAAVEGINLKYDDINEKKDSGIGFQSELRAYKNEKELNLPSSIADLTGINTPVVSVLEHNMFYFSQIIEFGKVLVAIQEMPNDPKKTLATAMFVIGVKKRTYDLYDEVGKFFRGESIGNYGTGLTQGLPKFIQGNIDEISTALEKK